MRTFWIRTWRCFILSFVAVIVVQLPRCSTLCDPHGLQHVKLPCPSLSPRVCSNSCPLIQWCHPTISSSVALFSFCLQSFPASGTFLVSQLFISGGQSIGALASASVLPMNIQGWFPLGLTIYHINLSDLKYHISHLKWCFLWKLSFNLGMTSF